MESSVYIRETRQRLFALEHEFERVDIRHRQLSGDIEKTREFLAMLEREHEDTDPDLNPPVRQSSSVIAAMCDVLRDGKAQHRKQILKSIQKRGVYVSSSNPMNTLSVMLSRDDRFVSERRGYWKLARPPDLSEPDKPELDPGLEVLPEHRNGYFTPEGSTNGR